jgi:hypothetical protein
MEQRQERPAPGGMTSDDGGDTKPVVGRRLIGSGRVVHAACVSPTVLLVKFNSAMI